MDDITYKLINYKRNGYLIILPYDKDDTVISGIYTCWYQPYNNRWDSYNVDWSCFTVYYPLAEEIIYISNNKEEVNGHLALMLLTDGVT